VLRDSGFSAELVADVGHDPVVESHRIHGCVEELRAELADDGEVDPILDLGERIRARGRRDGPCGRKSLVKFHHDLHAERRFAPSTGSWTCGSGRGSTFTRWS